MSRHLVKIEDRPNECRDGGRFVLVYAVDDTREEILHAIGGKTAKLTVPTSREEESEISYETNEERRAALRTIELLQKTHGLP